ncbi:MAG: hypothetical protein Q8859_08535, partial [Bacteroidota bacterium]|nr:hypothetical protein [Bacteroidota bacterium]
SKLSVRDVYTYPTVKELAGYVDKINATKQSQEASKSKTEQNPKVNLLTYYTVAFLQIISIVFFYGIASMFAISPFIVKHYDADVTYPLLALYCTMGMLLAYPLFLLLSIVFKWVIIGRFKEGAYPLWGFYYFRFWLVKKIVDLTPIPFLTGTPFLSVYFRLMGATIGKDVYIGSDRLRLFDLVSIDDHSSISKEAHVMGYSVENGMLRLGRITIGKSCFVGARALLGENSKMEDQSALLELSMLRTGASIPFGEIWRGSPARPCSQVDSIWLTLKKDQPQPVSLLKRIGLNTVHALAMLGVLLLPTLLLVPYSMTILYIEADYSLGITLLSIIPLSALYIFAFCVSIAAIKWIVLGRLKPVNIPIHSLLYIRKWIVDTLISCSLLFFKSLYATLFLPPWLRLIGAKIGKRAEISTVNYISTDLLRIDQESFLADSVNVGPPLVINGTMIFRRTHIGSRSFVGNSAVLPTGGRVEDGCLIGVLSITPSSPEQAQMKDASWLGSPPIFLPKRQESPKFPEKYTFKPTKGLFFLRGFIEFFKITIPFAISTLLFFLFYSYSYHVFESGNYNRFLYESPLVLLLICMSTILFGVFFKKLLIGKYKPDAKPLWCTFVWRNEFVNSISENLVYPFFEYMVLGTPFAPLYFRLMGCKIGKRVYMETTEITEFDLVNVGDDSSLNYICTIQTHLFEDRVMKMSHVNIGRDCNVGSLSVVLYDTRMHNNTSLSGLSLLMKGETLPENTNWQGSPCQLQK